MDPIQIIGLACVIILGVAVGIFLLALLWERKYFFIGYILTIGVRVYYGGSIPDIYHEFYMHAVMPAAIFDFVISAVTRAIGRSRDRYVDGALVTEEEEAKRKGRSI